MSMNARELEFWRGCLADVEEQARHLDGEKAEAMEAAAQRIRELMEREGVNAPERDVQDLVGALKASLLKRKAP